MHNVISFYRYTEIKNPKELVQNIKKRCSELEILGRILIAHEGINGAVCGKLDEIEHFKTYLQELFQNLTFREQHVEKQSYHKLVVRDRKEIVHFGTEVNVERNGSYVTPDELKAMYDNNDDFIVVDARNTYEADVGKFENAVIVPTETFREFPEKAKETLKEHKDKKMVLYCTGGIRCEKATAYLKQEGFFDVHHLKGGIIDYANKYKEHYEGGLFVFDDRLVEPISKPITKCEHCDVDCDRYINCHNIDCDKLFICCEACEKEYNSCCSKECVQAPRQRPRPMKKIGKILNYFAKAGIAHALLDEEIQVGNEIIIHGKTTKTTQKVTELIDENENKNTASKGEITFPVSCKVRKNDVIAVYV